VTAMATLEMIPLRSMYPNSGRMTLRYTMPAFDVDLDAETLDRAVSAALTDSTTPQVAGSTPDGETTARKGGEAR